jgi:hypothetical protein
MTTTPAFDLALFVGHPANVNDGVVVSSLGPPFATQFKPLALAGTPGVTLSASVPAANAVNQIMVSGPGPGFSWGLALSPAAAAAVPPATAQNQTLMSNAALAWQNVTTAQLLAQSNAVVTNASTVYSFDAASGFSFTPVASLTTRINGGDATKSAIDNFTLDAGTF